MTVSMALAVLIFLFGVRYLYSKEKLAMIEKGPASTPGNFSGFSSTKLSFLIIGVGIGMFLSFILSEFAFPNIPDEPIYFSLVPICTGLGLLASNKFSSKN